MPCWWRSSKRRKVEDGGFRRDAIYRCKPQMPARWSFFIQASSNRRIAVAEPVFLHQMNPQHGSSGIGRCAHSSPWIMGSIMPANGFQGTNADPFRSGSCSRRVCLRFPRNSASAKLHLFHRLVFSKWAAPFYRFRKCFLQTFPVKKFQADPHISNMSNQSHGSRSQARDSAPTFDTCRWLNHLPVASEIPSTGFRKLPDLRDDAGTCSHQPELERRKIQS